MSNLIEEFEKLPEIAKRIAEANSLNYDEKLSAWTSPEWDSTTCCNQDFVNAAYYAFQEQQKKIDAVFEFIDSDELGHDARLGDFYRDIEELLK